ncbi:MAG: C25 family cysteine peptidase [bacterium]
MKTAKLNQFRTLLIRLRFHDSRLTIHGLPKRFGAVLLAWWFRQPAIGAIIVLTVMATAFLAVQAATIEWANVGSTFSTAANWVGGTAPANSTATDIGAFGSAGAAAVNPSLTANRSINGISFLSGAYAYTFGSTGFTLLIGIGGITDSATNVETFGSTFNIATSASQTWTSNSGATLDFEGVVDLNNNAATARTLTLTGAGNFIFNGTVQNSNTGSTGNLTYSGTGMLTLSGNNTYNGTTTLSSGTVAVGNNSAFGTGAITLGNTTLQAINASRSINNNVTYTASTGATVSGSQNFTFNGVWTDTASRTLTSSLSGGNTLTLAGNVFLSDDNTTGSRVLTINGTGNTTISGVIANNNLGNTVAAGLTYSGSGTLTLSNANTYTGPTTISAGTLTLGNSGVIANASNITLNGGTFQTGAAGGFTETVGTLALTDHSQIALGTGSHTLTFAASNGVAWTAGKKLVITGWTGGYNGTSGTSGQIFVGSTSSGLTAGQLAQISFYDGVTAYSATILSTGEVVPAAPTAVRLTKFNAASFSDGVQLRWESGYEVNNLGYRLYREQNGKRTRVTASIIAGSALLVGQHNHLTAGYSYSWFDPQGTPDTSYYLEAMDLNGSRETSGPIYPHAGARNTASPKLQRALLLNEVGKPLANNSGGTHAAGWPAAMSPTNLGLSNIPTLNTTNLSVSNRQALAVQQAIAGGKAVKISVRQSGWYRVTQPELVAAGLDPSADARLLQVFVDGAEVSVRLSTEGTRLNGSDTLEFYGVALDTTTTDTHTYWLIHGNTPGKRISVKRNKIRPGDQNWTESSGLRSFAFTAERREKLIYSPRLLNGDADNIFGALIFTDPTEQTLAIKNFDRESATPIQLEVTLQGLTGQDHEVQIMLNGANIGSMSFGAFEHPTETFAVNRSLLREGDNTVSLASTNGDSDISFVDYLRLTYAHQYIADSNALRFSMPGGAIVRVDGFTTVNIRVVDITNPDSPLELATSASPSGAGYAVKVQGLGADMRTLIAFADDLTEHPSSIAANKPSSWKASTNGADLLMVTHKNFRQAIEPLATLRRNQGLSVAVVDVEDVYDEFSYGAHTPVALKGFLSWAASNWTRKPEYLLLVGDSSWDPRNYMDQGANDFVPTKLIDTSFMETASDDWLVDFTGQGHADIALGRLPGRTAAEVSLMVSKIMAYEQERELNVPLRGAVMVADTGFESKSADTGALLPANVAIQSINRAEVGNDDLMRGQLIDALNQGPMIANFYGHGSVGVWTNASVLDSDLAAGLTNANRSSIYFMMTCLNGYAHDAYIDSLSEAVLKAPSGGAVAVWASSGFTSPDPQFAMNSQFYRLLFGAQPLRLGEAAREAKLATSDLDVRRTWMLFGDPTMRVR